MDKAKKTYIMNNVLRRGVYRWPGRWLAEKRTHLPELKKYYCELCGTVSRKKDTQMDHIDPVVPVTGWDNWEGILERMYCAQEGWQRLCKPCHQEKTQAENALRGDPVKAPKKKSKKRTKRS